MGEYLRENLEALGAWLAHHRAPIAKTVTIALVVIGLPIAGLLLLPTVLGHLAPPLDLKQDLYAANRPLAFTFLDADGKEVGHRGAVTGERLHLEDMPPYLPAAFIAMEDRRFYQHHGFDVRGIARALIHDMRVRRWAAGGSTITQQTAKIVFTNSERTFSRKYSDLVDAAALEKSLSKKQILELYLNRIYLGSGAYGVDAAAHVYFGKSARQLTLAEAAMLATLTRAPSAFTPRRDLAAAQDRSSRVLSAMVETGAISQAQADAARNAPAPVSDTAKTDARNWFLDSAADEAKKLATENGVAPMQDLRVYTTLDPRIEEAAREAALHVIRKNGRKAHASEASVVVMKTDGAIAALIGGVDYEESVFDRATQARRQPGSAFKPFVYLAALEAGLTPWDVRDDEPVDINGWTPTNYGGRSYGTLTLADALAHSVNTITANLAQEVGVTTVIEVARRCGITSPLEANASLALGTSEVTPLELTAAYGAFASGGNKITPYFVTEVDAPGGRVLYQRKSEAPERVIADHVNRDLTAMLYGVVTGGTGMAAAIPGHEAAGKTGTTQDYHDAWFVGFTKDYVTSVWVGNDDSTPMRGITGGSLPAQIWKSVMISAENGLPATPLDRSSPEPPSDTGLFGSGVRGPVPGDDEASLRRQQEQQDAQQQEPQPQGAVRRSGFWDWVFGRNEQPAPPPPPPRGSDNDDSN